MREQSRAPGKTRISDLSIYTPVIEDWAIGGNGFEYYTYFVQVNFTPACGDACRVHACAIGSVP